MNSFLNYLVEANLGILVMLGSYWFLLRKETNFDLKRAFLIGGVVLSLLFPLLQVGDRNEAIPAVGNVLPTYLLPELVIGEDSTTVVSATESINYWRIAAWIYLTGVGILLLHLFFQLGKLLIVFRRHTTWTVYGKYKILEVNDPLPIFSFFHYIVLGNAESLTREDKEQIIRHEIVHARQHHSADVLLLHAAKILLWFNPFIYIYEKTLSDIHEFQADEKAVKHQDVQTYCSLLAKITLQSAGFSFANHFNKSITIKRIEMMKTIKTKISKWKIAAMATVAAGFFFVVACQDQVMTEISDVVQSSTMALDLPPSVQTRLDELRKTSPQSNFIVSEMTGEAGSEKLEALTKEYGGLGKMAKMEVIKLGAENNNRGFVILEFNEATSKLADATVQDGEIFLVVEETAAPKEGMNEYFDYIKQRLQYPREAKDAGIEGRVFVECVVEKDGTLTNIQVLKGIGYGCDEAAIQAVENSPAWKPAKQRGKPVRQKMVFPIYFKLGGDSDASIQTGKIEPSNLNFNIDVQNISVENDKTYVAAFVKDENGNPLRGANVVVNGTTNGTVTDQNGKFIISLPKGGALTVSFVGYETKTMTF